MDNVYKIKDLVIGTSSNVEGQKLYDFIVDQISKKSMVIISFENSTPISSSFFNSSFGSLIDQYGYSFIKDNIKLINLNKSQSELLKKYFTLYMSVEIVH